jgi:diguanylate cyclase (GGDEF)-like protein/PAS domain S-box-containing protein
VTSGPGAREGRLRRRLLAYGPFIVTFGLVALLWAIVLVSSVIQHERISSDAQQQLRLVNNAVVQHTRGLLQGIESNLQVLDHWVQSHPQNDPRQDAALAELIARLDQGADGLVSMGFASKTGSSVAVAGTPAWQVAMPAVPWPETGKTRVGVPLRAGPGQPWRWPVTRRINPSAGDIAGAVAWIDLARLSALHESLRYKPAGAISLATSDAVVIVRAPWTENQIGTDFRARGPLRVLPASAPQGLFSYGGTAAEGHERTVSYERLDRYPVTVFVSQAVDETMAAFHARRKVLLTGLSVITVLAFLFSFVLARAQRAARRSQAEFAAVSAAFPLGLFRADAKGETTYANDAYFEQLGLPRERMAWGWSEIVEESQRDEVTQTWRKAVAAGRSIKDVLHIRHPVTGQEAVMSVRSAPLMLDGRVVGQVGSLEDVTERIQQQRAQRMLTAIFEKSTDIVAQVAPDGRMLYLNPAGRARLSIGPDESLGALRYDDFTPAHRELQVRDEIMPTALAQGIWVGETSVLADGGQEIDVSEMLIVHRDEEQRVETFSIVMRDISREVQARMQLQRSDAILNIVASTLPASVAVLDDQQRYLFTNDAFDHLVGRAHGSLIGMTMREALDDAAYELRRPHVAAALAGQRTMFESERGVPGRALFLETTYIPFRAADGRVAGFVGLGQDVTTHRLQQQKLLDASQTDPLTGVLNRAGFDQRIHEALARAQAKHHLLALLYLDLDGFKPVNDEHGHAAGDTLLSEVARRLQRVLRPSDVLARLGGDEFAVVLNDAKDATAAQAVARKIVGLLGEEFQVDGKTIRIGASVGVALAMNGQDTIQGLLQRADAALYQAKRTGRGRFEMAAEA